jgi:hypothetical protein
MTSRIASLLTAVTVTVLVVGCGSSSHSSARATTTTTTTAPSGAPPNVTIRLPGTSHGVRPNVAALRHLPEVHASGIRAHLAGVDGLSLSQKLQALADNADSYWVRVSTRLSWQLSSATVTIVDQTPVTCGSSQIATTDNPAYCRADQNIALPLAFIQSNIEPIGDAAVALVISDLYGYHIENVLGVSAPSSGLAPADLQEIDSCLSGTYFANWLHPSGSRAIQLSSGDEAAVNKLIAAETATPGGPGAVTATQLTAAFNKGAVGRRPSLCIPKSGGG